MTTNINNTSSTMPGFDATFDAIEEQLNGLDLPATTEPEPVAATVKVRRTRKAAVPKAQGMQIEYATRQTTPGGVLFDGSDVVAIGVVASGMVKQPWIDPKDGIQKGSSIPWQAKRYFSKAFAAFQDAINKGDLHAGEIFMTTTSYKSRELQQQIEKQVVFLVVGDHNETPNSLTYIESCLTALVEHAQEIGLAGKSISFPKLGTGLGKLAWDDVAAVMVPAIAQLPVSKARIHISATRDIRYQPKYDAAGKVTGVERDTTPIAKPERPAAPVAKAAPAAAPAAKVYR